jgi:hypothetical protein
MDPNNPMPLGPTNETTPVPSNETMMETTTTMSPDTSSSTPVIPSSEIVQRVAADSQQVPQPNNLVKNQTTSTEMKQENPLPAAGNLNAESGAQVGKLSILILLGSVLSKYLL